MFGVFVENIEAFAEEIFCFAGQQVIERRQRIDTGFVDIVDGEIVGVGHHHVDGHIVDHCAKPLVFLLRFFRCRHDFPYQTDRYVVSVAVVDRVDLQVEDFSAERDVGAPGQI